MSRDSICAYFQKSFQSLFTGRTPHRLRQQHERPFQPEVPDDYVEAVVRVMVEANWHTYQVLTKRRPPREDAFRALTLRCQPAPYLVGGERRRQEVWAASDFPFTSGAGRRSLPVYFDADDRMGDGVDGMVAHPLSFSTALLNMQYADDFGSQGAIIAVEMVEVSNRGADHSDPRLCHIERLMPMTADAENFVLDSESD